MIAKQRTTSNGEPVPPVSGQARVSRRRARTGSLSAGVVTLSAATLLVAGCASNSGGAPAGSASSGGSSSGFTVAFANITEQVPIFHTIHTTTASLLKNTNVKVTWYDNNEDSSTMISNAQLMAQSKPDGIVEYPTSPDSTALGAALTRNGVPCVSIDFPTPDCTSLTVEATEYGAQAAEIMATAAKQRGWNSSNTTLLVGQNAAAGQSGNGAVQGFYSTIAPLLGYKPLNASQITPSSTTLGANAIQFDGQSSLQPAYQAVTSLMAAVPSSRHVILFTLNDESTVGALRAIDARGTKSDVLVIGVGADPQALTLLKTDPRWVGEVDILAPFWGEYAVATAEQLAAGKKEDGKTPATLPLPFTIMNKTTVQIYYPGNAVLAVKLPPLSGPLTYLSGAPVLAGIGNVGK